MSGQSDYDTKLVGNTGLTQKQLDQAKAKLTGAPSPSYLITLTEEGTKIPAPTKPGAPPGYKQPSYGGTSTTTELIKDIPMQPSQPGVPRITPSSAPYVPEKTYIGPAVVDVKEKPIDYSSNIANIDRRVDERTQKEIVKPIENKAQDIYNKTYDSLVQDAYNTVGLKSGDNINDEQASVLKKQLGWTVIIDEKTNKVELIPPKSYQQQAEDAANAYYQSEISKPYIEQQIWGITQEETRRENPYWEATRKDGQIYLLTPEFDEGQRMKYMTAQYGAMSPLMQDIRFGTALIGAAFKPETYVKMFGGAIEGGKKNLLLGPTLGAVGGVWESTMDFEYELGKKEGIGKWLAFQAPAYENVIIPALTGFAFTGALGLIAKSGEGLVTAATATGKALTTAETLYVGATKVVPVATGALIAGTVASQLTYTGLEEYYGKAPAGTFVTEVTRTGMQFGFLGLGAKEGEAFVPRIISGTEALETRIGGGYEKVKLFVSERLPGVDLFGQKIRTGITDFMHPEAPGRVASYIESSYYTRRAGMTDILGEPTAPRKITVEEYSPGEYARSLGAKEMRPEEFGYTRQYIPTEDIVSGLRREEYVRTPKLGVRGEETISRFGMEPVKIGGLGLSDLFGGKQRYIYFEEAGRTPSEFMWRYGGTKDLSLYTAGTEPAPSLFPEEAITSIPSKESVTDRGLSLYGRQPYYEPMGEFGLPETPMTDITKPDSSAFFKFAEGAERTPEPPVRKPYITEKGKEIIETGRRVALTESTKLDLRTPYEKQLGFGKESIMLQEAYEQRMLEPSKIYIPKQPIEAKNIIDISRESVLWGEEPEAPRTTRWGIKAKGKYIVTEKGAIIPGEIAKRLSTQRFYAPMERYGIPSEPIGDLGIKTETILVEKPAVETKEIGYVSGTRTGYVPDYKNPYYYEPEVKTVERPLTREEYRILYGYGATEETIRGGQLQMKRGGMLFAPTRTIGVTTAELGRTKITGETPTTVSGEGLFDLSIGETFTEGWEEGRPSMERTDILSGFKMGILPMTRTDVKQELQQLQQSKLSKLLVTPTTLAPIEYTLTRPRPRPSEPTPPEFKPRYFPPAIRRQKEEEGIEMVVRKPKRGRELLKPVRRPKAKKTLYADILSVTQTQAEYGKATQPMLSSKVWKESARHLYLRTPTREQQMFGKGGLLGNMGLFSNNKRGILNMKNKRGGNNAY